jgi:hypothetical protein
MFFLQSPCNRAKAIFFIMLENKGECMADRGDANLNGIFVMGWGSKHLGRAISRAKSDQ